MFPALPGLCQRVFQLFQPGPLNAHAVVTHADVKQPFLPQRIDPDTDHAALLLGGDAVLERVFHNGLQNKRGHHGLRQVQRIRDAPLHPDAVAKSDMVDRVIFIHDPHLPGEGHLLVVAHEAVPQQMGQCRDEGLGAVGLFCACRLQNDVEGVEKEMRVDLAAQLL